MDASPPEDMCRLPAASLIICFWLVERIHGNSSLQDSMAERHTRFAVSLYQTLTETENSSNLIVSPLSISVSLGLLQLGARGNTLAQLEGTLGYNVKGGFRPGILPFGKRLRRCSLPAVGLQRSSAASSAVGTRCCGAAAIGPAEHIGVWSHNTCIHTSTNLINHSCSSASGVKRSLLLMTNQKEASAAVSFPLTSSFDRQEVMID